MCNCLIWLKNHEYRPVQGAAMTAAQGVYVVGYFDCPGGGQVVVRDNVAYIGHIAPPHGTTIIDVGDPTAPRQLAQISIPDGLHSHKVRVENGVMVVNRETYPPGRPAPDFQGGVDI